MADSPSSHRVALVTGGTGGIGIGVVLALTQRGFDVVVSDRAIDPAAADDPRTRAAANTQLAFVKGDLADISDHPRFLDEVFVAFGRLDSLVNNAGVSAKVRGDLLDVKPDSYDLNFAVNTRGAFFHASGVQANAGGRAGRPGERPLYCLHLLLERSDCCAGARRVYAMSKAAVAMMAKL